MIPAFTPTCQFCLQPMQKCTEKSDANGRVIYVQYICTCQGIVRYENYHAGDKHQERKDAPQVHQG